MSYHLTKNIAALALALCVVRASKRHTGKCQSLQTIFRLEIRRQEMDQHFRPHQCPIGLEQTCPSEQRLRLVDVHDGKEQGI